MLTAVAPYLVALAAMSFSALSARTIIRSVNRFDPPNANVPLERASGPDATPAEKPRVGVAA